jgi:hypothetical protein
VNKSAKLITSQLLGTWLFLRCLTSLVVAAISPLYPLTTIEKSIALWPPAGNVSAWLERVFVAPWLRWDAVWFGRILVRGYAAWDGTTSFLPLYPWLSWPLYRLGLDPILSLLITSSLAALLLFGVFHRLAAHELPPAAAWTALLLLVTFPIAFILFAPYSESLFLLWAALALFAMRRSRWGLVALFSFLAALTRQQGIFLALPMLWWAWEASGRSLHGLKKAWRAWLTTLAAPAGLAAWAIYRMSYLHEGSLDFSNPQGLIYSALLSPSASMVVKGQAFRWPWQAFAVAISKAIHTPEINVFVNLVLGLGLVLAFGVAWKYLNIPDRLYSLAIILVSFSVTTGDYAYISLPRHLILALPIFIGLAAALKKPWQRKTLIAIQIIAAMFLTVFYVFLQLIP